MNPLVESLFELARTDVTEQHIVDYSPSDPSYRSYVELWTNILRTGDIPKRSTFDLSEVISLTGWVNSSDMENPSRFQQYRRFTSAVAVALFDFGNDSEVIRAPNYLARDLIIDTALDDQSHFNAVRHVFPVVRETLVNSNREEEYPFFTFGSMILAAWADDHAALPNLARQLIDDDATVRNHEWMGVDDPTLLFGLTNYDQLNADWLRFASALTNPYDDENLQLVIDALPKIAT